MATSCSLAGRRPRGGGGGSRETCTWQLVPVGVLSAQLDPLMRGHVSHCTASSLEARPSFASSPVV